MVKIRIEGTPEELQQVGEILTACPGLCVLHVSEAYKNRGNNRYSRIYIDAAPRGGKEDG